MTLSMMVAQNAMGETTDKIENRTLSGQNNILPSSLSPDQVSDLLADQGLSLQESIVGREGTPQPWSVDNIVGTFGNTKSDYQKVWEPWITRAATHTVAVSDDGEFLAVGTGYLSDNQIHIYRWHPDRQEYVLVSQAGDGEIGGDVVDIGFADVDNNGFIDIAAASTDGYVYLFEQAHIYDPQGSTENRFDLVWKSPRMLKAAGVAVYDADLDGITDVIAGGWDGKIRVFEYRERSPYPFSEEHTKYLKEVFVSDYLGSPVQQVRAGDFDGDFLPEFVVGLRDGTILIYENAGETIDTPNGPFPITYDNFYKQVWNDSRTIWRPILDIQVDDVDGDGMTEAAIVALGQDVYLLDNDGTPNEYVFDKITRSPQSWERSGVYPIDYYMDILMNASNIYFNGNLSAAEPLDWKDGGNKVSPYTSGMANRSDSYYSLLRASAGKVWALMDWGSYEELVPGGNDEADILIHLNSPWYGNLADINMTLSTNMENWVYLDTSNMWLSKDKKTIYMDVDPIASELKWKFIRYMNMTLEGNTDMEIVYWETARINMRLGDVRSVMFSEITGEGGTSEKVLTASTADGKLLSFEYVPLSERKSWQPRMRMLLNSYEDQLFSIDTGGAWQMVPDPKHRMVPNWKGPYFPYSTTVTQMTGLSSVQQVTLGPSLHPYFYLIGDDTPNDIYFVGENNSVGFIPDPYFTDYTDVISLNPQIFNDLNAAYSGYTKIRIAVMDILYMPWESARPIPEILVSYYNSPNVTAIVGDEFGTSYSGIDLYIMNDWQGNLSLMKFYRSEFGFDDESKGTIIDISGALRSVARGLAEPLEMGTGDFDGDGLDDLVVSDGRQLQLFKQDRSYRQLNGTLTLVPGFFDEINKKLETDNKKLESLQGVDYDNDGDADLVASLKGRYGFTFYENIGNSFDPIWREKRSFLHNREPISTFTNYNYDYGVIWWNPDTIGSTPSYEFFAINDSLEIGMFRTAYSGQQAWVLATYPEVKVILTNFGNSETNKNWGFEYFESWSNTLLSQNWTQAMDVGILDGDDNREIVIADYDNNLYVFEHMTNNTYKRAYRSPDLVRIETTTTTPYASNVLIGIDAPINRSIFENARRLIAGVDLDNDGLLEIILATERQIFRFEATGYNDEYELAGQLTMPASDYRASLNSKLAEINLDKGITAIEAINDMDGNGFGEIVVGFDMYLAMFELMPNGDFKEIMGYDIEGRFSGELAPYYPVPFGPNPVAMPYGEITALLVEDLDKDGFVDIVVGGKTNQEIGGYPGFLRILTMGTGQSGTPVYAWHEVWNETYISGFMERNYVTSLDLDDQNYDGNLDLIVGHKYGFDILDLSDIFATQNRVTSVSGSPGYPIENYTPVIGFPRNNGSSLNMYSSSITKGASNYYYAAYSEILSSRIDPLNYDSRYHIFLSRSSTPEKTDSWGTPFYPKFLTSGTPQYSADGEIMPSLTYSGGFWVLTWSALTYINTDISNVAIWVAWTDDFYNWNKFAPYQVFSWSFSGNDPQSIYPTTPQVVPRRQDNSAEYAMAFAWKNLPLIYFFTFAILTDGTIIPSIGGLGNTGITAGIPEVANATYTNFKIHSIAMTNAEPSSPDWFDLAVAMSYETGAGTPNIDIWHYRAIPSTYYNSSLGYTYGNWSRITSSYRDEIYPAIARVGSNSQGLLVSYLEKSRTVADYDIKAITGIGSGWPYQWSSPSEIPSLPYEFHTMRRFKGKRSVTVFDGRLYNEAFKNNFEFDVAKYNLFEAPSIKIGRPALAPYQDGYAMAYAFTFRDPFTPFYIYVVNLGDTKVRIPIRNIIGEVYVISNPTDSFLYTDISETVDVAVGDTDRDGRREVLAGYGRTAELFELQQWETTGKTIYSSEWTDDSLEQNLTRLQTTAVNIFDANGNGFEEIIVASRAGDVRAFEISDTTLGVSLGSAIPVTDLGALTDANWKDVASFQWNNQSSLIAMFGEVASDPSQKIIRIYYNVTNGNLGNYVDTFENTPLTPKYVMAFSVNSTTREAIIASVYYNNTKIEVRTHKFSGQTISLASDVILPGQPLMTTGAGGPRPFEPIYGIVDATEKQNLLISSTEWAFLVGEDGSVLSLNVSLGSEKPLGFDLGDTDGDGFDEIITSYANNTAAAWLVNGTLLNKWQLPTDIAVAQWYGVAATDINNDGREDLVVGRMADGLVAAIDTTSGEQFWNITIGSTGYLYFRALQKDGNEMIYIVNGYGGPAIEYAITAITLTGIQRWAYKPTNAFRYAHEVTYDQATKRFLAIFSDVSYGLSGNELLVAINLGGAVEAISYGMTSGLDDVDQVAPLNGNTAIGISETSARAVLFEKSLPVTWSPSTPSMERLGEIVYHGTRNYDVVIDDVNRDGIDEYIFYSLEDNMVIVANASQNGLIPIFSINASQIDIKHAPFLYKNSVDDVSYLVLANYTHLVYVETQTLTIKTTYNVLANDQGYIREIATSDLLYDGNSEFYLELVSYNPETDTGFFFISGFTRRLLVFGDNNFAPIQELQFPDGYDLSGYSSNKNYFGFIDSFVAGGFFDLTFYSHVRVWSWATGTGLVTVMNYTQYYYVNFAFAPNIGEPSDETLFLVSLEGIITRDPNVSDGLQEIPYVSMPEQYLFSSSGYYVNRTYSSNNFREFRVLVVPDGIGGTETLLFVGVSDGPYLYIYGTAGNIVASPYAFNNVQLMAKGDYVEDRIVLGIGNGIVLSNIDGSPLAPYGYLAQGFILEAGFWGTGDMDIWYKTMNGDFVLAGFSISDEEQTLQSLFEENLYEFKNNNLAKIAGLGQQYLPLTAYEVGATTNQPYYALDSPSDHKSQSATRPFTIIGLIPLMLLGNKSLKLKKHEHEE